MTHNDNDNKDIETMINELRDVRSSKVVFSKPGVIDEVHVISHTEKDPKMVARDVQTVLKASGFEVNHRKISVAKVADAADPAPTAAAGRAGTAVRTAVAPPEPGTLAPDALIIEDVPRPEDQPVESRVRFERIMVTHAGGRVIAEVALKRDELAGVGESASADTGDGHIGAVIQATLQAMLQLHEADLEFSTPQFRILTFGREEVIVVFLASVKEREIRSFTGSAVIRQDLRQAAVLATLSALNRVSAQWPARQGLEFEIE